MKDLRRCAGASLAALVLLLAWVSLSRADSAQVCDPPSPDVGTPETRWRHAAAPDTDDSPALLARENGATEAGARAPDDAPDGYRTDVRCIPLCLPAGEARSTEVPGDAPACGVTLPAAPGHAGPGPGPARPFPADSAPAEECLRAEACPGGPDAGRSRGDRRSSRTSRSQEASRAPAGDAPARERAGSPRPSKPRMDPAWSFAFRNISRALDL